jgi:S1-C subfamily serine protease
VDQVMPPIPSVFSHVQSFLSSEGFPPVFVDLAAPLASNVPVPDDAAARAIAGPAVFSTVKVLGDACGYQQEGSAFVVGRGLLVTNAHVVAGEDQTEIRTVSGTYPATVVLYDPSFDLAVLRTDAPLGPALSLDPRQVARGTEGAVLGYPENGSLRVDPAGITANLVAQGRDIYNEGLVTRDVYQIDARVLPGNSGGPIVAPGMGVVGVVFSRSTVYPDVGYALSSPGVLTRVDRARTRTAPVSTGACVAD